MSQSKGIIWRRCSERGAGLRGITVIPQYRKLELPMSDLVSFSLPAKNYFRDLRDAFPPNSTLPVKNILLVKS